MLRVRHSVEILGTGADAAAEMLGTGADAAAERLGTGAVAVNIVPSIEISPNTSIYQRCLERAWL